MSKKNVEDVASNAYELGAIIKELQLKAGWERSALHGQRMRQACEPRAVSSFTEPAVFWMGSWSAPHGGLLRYGSVSAETALVGRAASR